MWNRHACLLIVLSSVLWGQPAELTEKARRAGELVRAGKAGEAIPIYQELLRTRPNDAGMILNLAIAEFKAKRYRDTIQQAQAALKLRPDLTTANLFLGASHFELGEHALAVGPLEKVVAALPDERNARLMLAEALLALDRNAEATGHFKKAGELTPDNPRVWYGLGRSYEVLAERAFQALEKSAPDSAYWSALAAGSYLRQRRFGTAFTCFQHALAKQPGLRGVHTGLADVYRLTGHADWAALEEERERTLPPPDCASPSLECEFAAGHYRPVIASRLETPEALYWAGKAYRELARESYECLGRLPPSLQSHLHAAGTYELQGLYPEAAAEWRAALKLSPGDLEIETGLARSLYRSGNFEAGLPLLVDLLKKKPGQAELNFLSGSSLLNLEQPEKAIPYLEAAIQQDPQFLPAHAALGHALLLVGKAEQAIPSLKTALSGDEDGATHFQLFRAYQVTGQAELARRALSQYQEFRKSLEAKGGLEEGGQITRP